MLCINLSEYWTTLNNDSKYYWADGTATKKDRFVELLNLQFSHFYPLSDFQCCNHVMESTKHISNLKRGSWGFKKRKIRSLRCRFTQNWVFLHTLFLEIEAQIHRNNYGTMLFLSNKSVCQKLAWSCKKWKSAKKAIYALFPRKPSFNPYLPKVFSSVCDNNKPVYSIWKQWSRI